MSCEFQDMQNPLHVLCDKPELAQKRSILVSGFTHLSVPCFKQWSTSHKSLFHIHDTEVSVVECGAM